jgi:DNA mismatch endonuclease, patch repair protein
MSRIRSRDTLPERMLRRELGGLGLRGWRNNFRVIKGVSSPDIAFTRWRIAVFVDGAFWHGHPKHFTQGKSGAYWDTKIKRNRERDAASTATLRRQGWRVIRAWDFEVERDPQRVAARVARLLAARKARRRP